MTLCSQVPLPSLVPLLTLVTGLSLVALQGPEGARGGQRAAVADERETNSGF